MRIRFAILVFFGTLALSPLFADDVALLKSGKDALSARAEMTQSGGVHISTYIFDNDEAGRMHLAMLLDAAKRGEPAELLLDTLNNRASAPMLRYLVENGVKVKVFHPLNSMLFHRVFRRLHDKLVVVDHKGASADELITGSRNATNDSFDMGPRPHQELDIYVRGQAATTALRHFKNLSQSNRAHEVTLASLSSVSQAQMKEAAEQIEAARAAVRALSPADRRVTGAAKPVEHVEFVHDNIKTLTGGEKPLLEMISRAEKSVVMENAYLVPTEDFRRAMTQAHHRAKKLGGDLVLQALTNSWNSSDAWPAQFAYEEISPRLLSMGIQLWEYQGFSLMHKKAMVVDGKESYVGSFNLDPRSRYLNSESGVIVRDPEVAKQILAGVETDKAASKQVTVEHKVRPRNPCTRLLRAFLLSSMGQQI